MVLAHFSIVGALRAISRAIQISFNICSSSTGLEMAAPQSGGTFKLCEWSKYILTDFHKLILTNVEVRGLESEVCKITQLKNSNIT